MIVSLNVSLGKENLEIILTTFLIFKDEEIDPEVLSNFPEDIEQVSSICVIKLVLKV